MVMLVYLSFLLLLYTRLLKAGAAGSANTTRSWNCCKHSCSWPGAGNVSRPVKTCDRSNSIRADYVNASSCDDGGEAYACADLQPWPIDNTTSYGFAAVQLSGETEKAWCCACYNLTFTSDVLQNRKMVVQAVSSTSGDSSTFDLQIPAGSLGGKSSCVKQYPQYQKTIWGSDSLGVSLETDCSSLPPALRAGCRWRFDWFEAADNPSVNFMQVPCPAALTEKSNCSRDDEMLQLAPVTTEPPPLPSQLGPLSPPQPPPRRPSISSNVKIIVAVCVPLFFITSTLAAYWLFRRQKTNLDRIPKTDVPGVPVYIQDLGIDHLHKRNAITIHELEMSPETKVPGSRRWTILKHTKPLPNIPVELKGSSVCKELEGNWEGPWM